MTKSYGNSSRALMSRDLPGTARLPYYARAYDGLRFPDQDQRIYSGRQSAGPSSQVQSGSCKRAADEVTVRPTEYDTLAYFRDYKAKGLEHLLRPSDQRWDPLLQTSKLTKRIYEV